MTMASLPHHSIVDPAEVISVVTPASPLWAVIQNVSGLNDDESPSAWCDWIFPVQALGTLPHTHMGASGAFLIADSDTGTVIWLRRCNGHMNTAQRNFCAADVYRVFFTNQKPERGQHPCPVEWGCTEYDKYAYECALFY